jgi:hypothetical protein
LLFGSIDISDTLMVYNYLNLNFQLVVEQNEYFYFQTYSIISYNLFFLIIYKEKIIHI